MNKPARMHRITSMTSTLLGLVLVILGFFGVFLLEGSGTWSASQTIPAGQGAVVIGPELASVLGPSVRIQVELSGDSTPTALVLSRGRADDVTAVTQSIQRYEIHQLEGTRRLRAQAFSGDPDSATAIAADVWQTRVAATNQVSDLRVAQPGAESVVVTRADGRALPELRVTMNWQNRWWLGYPAALLLLGALLLGLGFWVARFRAPQPAKPELLAHRFDPELGTWTTPSEGDSPDASAGTGSGADSASPPLPSRRELAAARRSRWRIR